MTCFDGLRLIITLILAILVFMSSLENFMLSRVEHEKKIITLRPGLVSFSEKTEQASEPGLV